jgi:hypothetical protein
MMAQFIKVKSKQMIKELNMVMAYKYGQMEQSMKAIGRMM